MQKNSQVVAISGSDIDKCLDKSLPLSDQRAKLITSHVHAVEVGHNIGALNIFANQSDFAETLLFITAVKISKGDFENSSLQSLGSNFCSLGSGNDGLATITLGKHGRSLDGVEFLSCERILGLLLATLLSL